ncbi:hypothetical protein D3C80_1807040 [compost metagenome]
MHRIGHQAPAGDLFVAVNARRIGIALALRGDLRGFGNDKRSRCTLCVVHRVHGVRDIARLCAARTRHWRHDHSVRGVQFANGTWGKQCGHQRLLVERQ